MGEFVVVVAAAVATAVVERAVRPAQPAEPGSEPSRDAFAGERVGAEDAANVEECGGGSGDVPAVEA